jgi:hypothetical protein
MYGDGDGVTAPAPNRRVCGGSAFSHADTANPYSSFSLDLANPQLHSGGYYFKAILYFGLDYTDGDLGVSPNPAQPIAGSYFGINVNILGYSFPLHQDGDVDDYSGAEVEAIAGMSRDATVTASYYTY